jgi:hypothetical protein
LKMDRSRDAANVPSWAKDAVKRRLEAAKGKKTLFPFSESGCQMWEYVRKKVDEKSALADFWPKAGDHFWSEMYLPKLREAAKAAGLDTEKIDSKTFRHTCGREMILKYGFDEAAAVLRDSVQTLRDHNADLLTSDVSTER